MNTKPLVVVFGGMSGAGKTTIVEASIKHDSRFERVVTVTTRTKRINEVDGVDYIFLTQEEFDRRLSADEFLESATVYGASYGTLRQTVQDILQKGRIPIINVDVQGLTSIRKVNEHWDLLSIFITTKNFRILRRRLYARAAKDGTPREKVKKRLAEAKAGAKQMHAYNNVVINDTVKNAVQRVIEHIEERLRSLTPIPAP